MMGMHMASALSARVASIEHTLSLLAFLQDRLVYLRPTMGELIDSACAQPNLQELEFLRTCQQAMQQGTPFPQAWKSSIACWRSALTKEDRVLLLSLAEVLGACDLDSQLSSIAFTREQIEHRLVCARQEREKYQKLYGTLGVLAGFAVAVVLI